MPLEKSDALTPASCVMKEYDEIGRWLGAGASLHEVSTVASLPAPEFEEGGRKYVSFSTNNYLGLANSQRLVARAREGLDRYGVGNCESRLLGGNLDVYQELETKLATLKKKETALVFATGYLTNLGVLSALVKPVQSARIHGYRPKSRYSYAYFSDEFNHLSIREGIRLSEVEKFNYRHRDLDHLESLLKKSDAPGKIIVSDGVFSQDGDIAPLPELLSLADRYDAMVYIDDAHGTGVLGAHGGGTSEHFGVTSPRLIQMGTLSKAYGAIGGFIATEGYIGDILRLTCSAYSFTSTLPPDQALACSEAIDMVRDEPERRARMWENQQYFLSLMDRLPYRILSRTTPIVPVFIGDEALCDRYAALLKNAGIHVDAVKFPAVGIRKARLRVMLNAGHTREQIETLAGVLDEHRTLLFGS
jgi:8-amino-7-oxononanoate synthase